MSDRARLVLLRAAMILITIIGAVYVFGAVTNLRQGEADPVQVIIALLIIGALVWMNRWWFRQTGDRI